MTRHWSERLSCQCGKTFRSLAAEAVHRHNFPILCRTPKLKKARATDPRQNPGARSIRRLVK